jgi:flagellar basal-body rod modification protein FlgD
LADAISTRSIWPNYSTQNVQSAAKSEKSDTLGKDQFLQILITQLRNQDPMQPLQDKEFIAQMAQFTSVEQLTNMNTELGLLRQNIGSASSLIGKTVEWSEQDAAGQTYSYYGTVEAILSKDGKLFAAVGGAEVPLDYISSISAESRTEAESTASSADESAGEDGNS